MSEMIKIPAILEGVATRKDRTLKLTFGTNELSPADAGRLLSFTEKFGYLAFKGEDFMKAETDALESLKVDSLEGFKSDSQRLRAVLYRMWEQDKEGFSSATKHYTHHMEKVIAHFKSRLK